MPDTEKGDVWSTLQRYMRELPKVIVKVIFCSDLSHPRVFQVSRVLSSANSIRNQATTSSSLRAMVFATS